MKAAVFTNKATGQKFDLIDRPDPKPAAGEVLVKVAYCGICGSDVHLVQAGLLPPGCVIGHELSGRVAAVGPGVEGFCENDPVVVMPMDPCFSCELCRRGHTQLCGEGFSRSYGLGGRDGGFAGYILAKPSMLFKIPEGLSLRDAAINEPWAVAVHAVNMIELPKDPVVLILGAGPIGLLSFYALRARGLEKVFVSEPDPFRARAARDAGAARVIDPSTEKPALVMGKEAGRPPDVVIDCAGTETSTRYATRIAGPRAQVLVLGIHMGPIPILPVICFAKEIKIIFSFGYTRDEFKDCIALLAKTAFNPDAVISDLLPLSEINRAFELLGEPGHMKILLGCGGE